MSGVIMTDTSKIQNYLQNIPEEKAQQLDVITKETLKQPYLLHIAANPSETYSPRVPSSALDDEDKTIPRICVAKTLYECILGYDRFESDIMNQISAGDVHDDFKGGYSILKFPFEVAVRPRGTLVPDSKENGEYWLVDYEENGMEYPYEVVGKIFLSNITAFNRGNQLSSCKTCFYIEITENLNLFDMPELDKSQDKHYSKFMNLTKGFYRVHTYFEIRNKRISEYDYIEVEEIREEDYKEIKQLSAAMLSDNSISYKGW
jgi:hypothetical protein